MKLTSDMLTQRAEPCQSGHATHETSVYKVHLGPQHPHDFGRFPQDRTTEFLFECFDESKYAHTTGWCQGRCAVACSVREQGVWENAETRLVVEILAQHGPGTVLDFGANQGWYTCVAVQWGCDVLAFESDHEIAGVCARNVHRNGKGPVTLIEGWVDEQSPTLDLPGDVLLLKSDVEGAEAEVVAMCWPLFEKRRIQFALLEVSPVFREGYGELLAKIQGCGYTAHRTNKMRDNRDPLARLGRAEIADAMAYVGSIRQENVLMVRT